MPIEFFDLLVVDECHRSIYGMCRQVLEHFDAHLAAGQLAKITTARQLGRKRQWRADCLSGENPLSLRQP